MEHKDNKVIYLKSLFKTFKPKETLPEDLKIEMAKLNLVVDETKNKPLDPTNQFWCKQEFASELITYQEFQEQRQYLNIVDSTEGLKLIYEK